MRCPCNTYHVAKKNRLYRIWRGMRDRCYNPNYHHYADYGGRGVVVCDEWKNSFCPFYIWSMSHGYQPDLTIDKDSKVPGNLVYGPDTCSWIPQEEQTRHRRSFKRRQRELPTGVRLYKGRYRAQISVGTKRVHLGDFSDPELASRAFQEARANLRKGALSTPNDS